MKQNSSKNFLILLKIDAYQFEIKNYDRNKGKLEKKDPIENNYFETESADVQRKLSKKAIDLCFKKMNILKNWIMD